jgi:hypothetical protein
MRLVCLSLMFFLTSTARAQMGPIPGEERFASLASGEENTFGAGLTFGAIGEDYFVLIKPRLDLNLGPVGLGLQVPLNLRVIDNDPKAENDFADILRKEDWDEPSDFLKVIRYVRYGRKHEGMVYARVGELAADLGHGTIMGRYMNNVDLNTFRFGSQLDIYTDFGGVETVISDYASMFADSPESRLIGGRLYVKPMALLDPESPFNIFAVGFTVAADLNAPRSLAGDIDEDGNYVVVQEATQAVYGFDAEARVVDLDMVKVTPYLDTNFINQAGWGLHLGLLFNFQVPFIIDLSIPARFEYRRFANNYLPTYFSTFYEIERYSFVSAGGAAPPKSAYVQSIAEGDGLNGYYGDAAFDFAGILQVGALYEDYDDVADVGGNFAAFLSVPALEVVQFKAYYTRTDVDDFADLFGLDQDSLLVAEGRYEVYTFTYLVGRFTRRWVPDPASVGTSEPRFKAEDDWNVGVEFAFPF